MLFWQRYGWHKTRCRLTRKQLSQAASRTAVLPLSLQDSGQSFLGAPNKLFTGHYCKFFLFGFTSYLVKALFLFFFLCRSFFFSFVPSVTWCAPSHGIQRSHWWTTLNNNSVVRDLLFVKVKVYILLFPCVILLLMLPVFCILTSRNSFRLG